VTASVDAILKDKPPRTQHRRLSDGRMVSLASHPPQHPAFEDQNERPQKGQPPSPHFRLRTPFPLPRATATAPRAIPIETRRAVRFAEPPIRHPGRTETPPREHPSRALIRRTRFTIQERHLRGNTCLATACRKLSS